MTRLALSLAAAAILASAGWSAFGKAVSPTQPQLQVIAHVFARAHRESVSAVHQTGEAAEQHFY